MKIEPPFYAINHIPLVNEYKYSKRFWEKYTTFYEEKHKKEILDSDDNITQEMYERYKINGFILRCI